MPKNAVPQETFDAVKNLTQESSVIVQGKVFGEARARDYQALKGRLMDAVLSFPALVIFTSARRNRP